MYKNILTVDSNVRIFAFHSQIYVSESNGARLCLNMSRNKFWQFTTNIWESDWPPPLWKNVAQTAMLNMPVFTSQISLIVIWTTPTAEYGMKFRRTLNKALFQNRRFVVPLENDPQKIFLMLFTKLKKPWRRSFLFASYLRSSGSFGCNVRKTPEKFPTSIYLPIKINTTTVRQLLRRPELFGGLSNGASVHWATSAGLVFCEFFLFALS